MLIVSASYHPCSFVPYIRRMPLGLKQLLLLKLYVALVFSLSLIAGSTFFDCHNSFFCFLLYACKYSFIIVLIECSIVVFIEGCHQSHTYGVVHVCFHFCGKRLYAYIIIK